MTGRYDHTIDPKGRLFLPSKLRADLGNPVYLAVGADHCLDIYPQEAWDNLAAKVAALPSSQAAMMDVFFANASRCEPDSQWRILIPQTLRDYAELEEDVVVTGNGPKARIWSRARWEAKEAKELNPENVANIMAALGI
jgi:MraZ protein